jgi:hypothetical protein
MPADRHSKHYDPERPIRQPGGVDQLGVDCTEDERAPSRTIDDCAGDDRFTDEYHQRLPHAAERVCEYVHENGLPRGMETLKDLQIITSAIGRRRRSTVTVPPLLTSSFRRTRETILSPTPASVLARNRLSGGSQQLSSRQLVRTGRRYLVSGFPTRRCVQWVSRGAAVPH